MRRQPSRVAWPTVHYERSIFTSEPVRGNFRKRNERTRNEVQSSINLLLVGCAKDAAETEHTRRQQHCPCDLLHSLSLTTRLCGVAFRHTDRAATAAKFDTLVQAVKRTYADW